MSVSWETFERYRQKGLDARRGMQWDSARTYLLEAARAMAVLSKEAQTEELRSGREEIARKLLELAKDCDVAKREKRKGSGFGVQGSAKEGATENEGAGGAEKWIVKEKPNVRFADVAGLDDV